MAAASTQDFPQVLVHLARQRDVLTRVATLLRIRVEDVGALALLIRESKPIPVVAVARELELGPIEAAARLLRLRDRGYVEPHLAGKLTHWVPRHGAGSALADAELDIQVQALLRQIGAARNGERRGAGQLGSRVRERRTSSGLRQEAVARRAGLSRRHLSDIETGLATNPRLHTLQGLAAALGCTVGYLAD